MAVLVQATIEHPFAVTVRVPIKTAARFLGNISDDLDRLGLMPSEEWSLKAEVENQNVHLQFALVSQEAADQLQAAISNATLDDPHTPQSEGESVGFEIGGTASARFLDVFRIPRNTKLQPLRFRDPTDT